MLISPQEGNEQLAYREQNVQAWCALFRVLQQPHASGHELNSKYIHVHKQNMLNIE